MRPDNMGTLIKWFVVVSMLAGCNGASEQQSSKTEKPTVVIDAKELGNHLDKEIIIVGIVEPAKVPTLLGIKMDKIDPALFGKQVQVEGILKKVQLSSRTENAPSSIQDNTELNNLDIPVLCRGPVCDYYVVSPRDGTPICRPRAVKAQYSKNGSG